MGRWRADARGRLERAALELFVEQGFSRTTVPQITARAGLTTRTFFRYFADKREVVFAGEDAIPAQVAGLIAAAPASLSPPELVVEGLRGFAASRFDADREQLRLRRAVIRADEGLRERELHKLDALTDAMDRGFRDRGADGVTSALAARIAVTVTNVAMGRWLDADDDEPLAGVVLDTLDAFRRLSADLLPEPPAAGGPSG